MEFLIISVIAGVLAYHAPINVKEQRDTVGFWPIVAVAIAALGAVASNAQANKQQRAQKNAADANRRNEQLKEARARRKAVRERNIKVGQAEQAAANQGATGSSSAAGGVGSIQTQAASNLGFLSQSSKISDQVVGFNTQSNQYAANIAGINALTSFGVQAAGKLGEGFSKPDTEG